MIKVVFKCQGVLGEEVKVGVQSRLRLTCNLGEPLSKSEAAKLSQYLYDWSVDNKIVERERSNRMNERKVTEFCEKVTAIHDAEFQIVCAAVQYVSSCDAIEFDDDQTMRNLTVYADPRELAKMEHAHGKLIEAVHHLHECIEQSSNTSSVSEEYPK